jgi:hypothetical protein
MTPDATVALAQILTQTGAIGLAAYLVIRQQHREDKMMETLERYAERLEAVAIALGKLDRWLSATDDFPPAAPPGTRGQG